MPTWKVILEAICVVIVAVLILFFVVPYLMEATGQVHPFFFEIEEEVRCHLFQRLGICLSLYPNPVKEGKKVEVTFRARRWYEDEEACVADETTKAPITDDKPACCILTKGKCKTEFVATSVDMSGKYFAFIDISGNKEYEGEEPKGEEKILTVNPAS